MTDYPTREAIDAAKATLIALIQRAAPQSDPTSGLAWNVMEGAVRVLSALDAIPGLHYPDAEPEPQRTFSEVLAAAEEHATVGSPEHHILFAAYGYVEARPEWFEASFVDHPAAMLQRAASVATDYDDRCASHTLKAAVYIALRHPEWFGGEA